MKFTLIEGSFKFYTDGEKTIKVYDGETPPDGFHLGRTFNSNPWNKGLTKDTNDKVKQIGLKTMNTRKADGSYISWNTGLTKETDDRLQQVADKVSAARKGKEPPNKGVPASDAQKKKQSAAMKGKVPYNKGLTKETCQSLMNASKKLLGHPCFVSDWEEAKRKEYETKKLNHSFNSSNPERQLIQDLIAEYGEDDVKHPYRDNRYPFNCDVYIKSLDLFIEYNGTIEHNGHPYNKDDPSDVAEAETIKHLAEQKGPQSRYWNILKWWTETDPKKLQTFRDNNLNFRIIYPNGLIIEK